jgi:hypothetical protein
VFVSDVADVSEVHVASNSRSKGWTLNIEASCCKHKGNFIFAFIYFPFEVGVCSPDYRASSRTMISE